MSSIEKARSESTMTHDSQVKHQRAVSTPPLAVISQREDGSRTGDTCMRRTRSKN